MDKLAAMKAFNHVVSGGNYAEAARALGLTRSAVSKAVSELERGLGVRLLDRTTRQVHPTEAGLALYERLSVILPQIDEAEAAIASLHDEPRGLLRLNAPATFGRQYLAPAVAEFLRLYPDLTLDMVLTDRFIDPLAEGFDVTVRIGMLADSSLVAKKLAQARLMLVASPDYLAKAGEPEKPSDLRAHDCLVYQQAKGPGRWSIADNGKVVHVPVRAVMTSNDGSVLAEAAVAGLGLALTPSFVAGPFIRDGRLKQVMPSCGMPPLPIYALYAPNRLMPAKTRLFIDFLVRRMAGVPEWEQF